MVFHSPCSVSRDMLSNENQAAFVPYYLGECEVCCLDYFHDQYQDCSQVHFQPPVDHCGPRPVRKEFLEVWEQQPQESFRQ